MRKYLIALALLTVNLVFSQEPRPLREIPTYYIRLNTVADIKIDSWAINAPQDKKLEGKFLVINLWVPNCVQCNVGMKYLERLQQDFKGVKNLYFINLAQEDSLKTAASFAKQKLSTTLIVASDKRKITKLRSDGLKQIMYPMAIMVDPEGVVRYIQFPSLIKKEEIQKFLDGKWEPFDSFYQNH
ncbi:redoxin family protein [Flavobacterium sp.]|uniref:TlpA family protein disulfide reductase n=1 Tax=Flavobacterium sp. TaxID=239 RepID=UPI0025BD50A9|nr:redoxin family protein [Flavobacterium sp.]